MVERSPLNLGNRRVTLPVKDKNGLEGIKAHIMSHQGRRMSTVDAIRRRPATVQDLINYEMNKLEAKAVTEMAMVLQEGAARMIRMATEDTPALPIDSEEGSNA